MSTLISTVLLLMDTVVVGSFQKQMRRDNYTYKAFMGGGLHPVEDKGGQMQKEVRAVRCDAGLTPVEGEGKEGRLEGKSWVCGTAPRKIGWGDEAIIERTAPSQEPPCYRGGPTLELCHVSQRPGAAMGSWALGPSRSP